MIMVDMGKFYEIKVSNDKMEAVIIQFSASSEDAVMTREDVEQFIKDHGIVYGLQEEIITRISENQELTKASVLAKGKQPENGKAAYLQPILFPEQMRETDSLKKIKLKEFFEIPAVRIDDIVGKKIAATAGIVGFNVFGEEVPAKPGKDFNLRKGQNTRVKEEEQALYSLIDGQISVDKHTVNVLPTYEVQGDLSLKTGNIAFVGNVIIKGNVPAGFEIQAEGDIRVMGIVEAARLKAGGTIFIGAGIVGQNKSHIEAIGDLQTTFINEGYVEVGGNIEVTQSILHSTCMSGGKVICKRGKGLIVGGSISAVKSIEANEIGNDMQTITSLFIGVHEKTIVQQKQMETDLTRAQDDFKKLAKLLKIYLEKEKQTGPLVGRDKLSKLKVQHSFKIAKQSIDDLSERLSEFKEEAELDDGFISAERIIFPNVSVHFGKYRRKIPTPQRQSRISVVNSDIHISPI